VLTCRGRKQFLFPTPCYHLGLTLHLRVGAGWEWDCYVCYSCGIGGWHHCELDSPSLPCNLPPLPAINHRLGQTEPHLVISRNFHSLGRGSYWDSGGLCSASVTLEARAHSRHRMNNQVLQHADCHCVDSIVHRKDRTNRNASDLYSEVPSSTLKSLKPNANTGHNLSSSQAYNFNLPFHSARNNACTCHFIKNHQISCEPVPLVLHICIPQLTYGLDWFLKR
jgi:hypothetical protein